MSEFSFEPGERDSFQRLWSWSFNCLVSGMTKVPMGDYDPKPDLSRLTESLLLFIVEQGSGCPLGYLAQVELLKRRGQLVDWKFDSFDSEGRINTSLVLKTPIEYTRVDFTLGSLETQ